MAPFDAPRAARALTGPLDVATFDEEIRERRAMRFERAFGVTEVAHLLDLGTLEALFTSGAIPLASVDVYEDGHLVRLADMQKKSGKTGLEIVAERFRSGATIRVRDVDGAAPHLGRFAAEVRRQFAAHAQINVYLTPPARDGFPPHFDITDVFVVQCLGEKAWRVFDGYTNRVELPLASTNWEPDRFVPTDTPHDLVLAIGDVLYLPRGVMHEARCTDRASMHLTISLAPLTFVDLLTRELQRLAEAHVEFRRRVPWSADEQGLTDPAAIADAARACLQTFSAQLDIAAALDTERAAIASGRDAGRDVTVDLAQTLGHLFEP